MEGKSILSTVPTPQAPRPKDLHEEYIGSLPIPRRHTPCPGIQQDLLPLLLPLGHWPGTREHDQVPI